MWWIHFVKKTANFSILYITWGENDLTKKKTSKLLKISRKYNYKIDSHRKQNSAFLAQFDNSLNRKIRSTVTRKMSTNLKI